MQVLSFEKITEANRPGFLVAAGQLFIVDLYADAFAMSVNDFDAGSVDAVVSAAESLQPGEILLVSH
jgi:hypothetical protein